jgi:NAD+ kinase
MKIILFGSQYDDLNDILICKIYDVLKKNGVDLFIEKSFFDKLKLAEIARKLVAEQSDDFVADIAVSLGGDGTFLNTAAKIGAKNIPVLGINAGRLGFLADVGEDEIDSILTEIIAGKFRLEERSVLKISLSDERISTVPFALNEIAVLKIDTSSMLNIAAFIDGEQVNVYKSDGLIISTPTGSTAYALSVGGPILTPDAKNFVIVPVASHSLTVRPLVICDSCEIKLKITSRTGSCQIAIDGRSFQISDKIEITIKKADFTIKSLQPQNHSFYGTLKNKLMWGKDARKN